MQSSKLQLKIQNFQRNILLASYTTFKIGGPAKYFYEAKDAEDIIKAVKMACQLNIPYFILGGGSNLLVSDKGFEGLVIKVQSSRFKVQSCRIFIDAGVKLSKLVDLAVKNSLTGLEWAAGIPGTIGGAVRGNAGAFGGSMSEIVKLVKVLRGRNIKQLVSKDLKFTYRDSIFKHNKDIILSTELQLKKGSQAEIKKQIKKNLQHRRENQPIKALSTGCVFKNVRNKLNKSAAELIEEAGLKNKAIGGAIISKKHANFIINTGKAKAEDVIILISLIKAKVRNKFGIQLQEEVQYVGF